MATILITHGVPADGFAPLEGHEILIPAPLCAYSRDELLALIPRADAVVAGGALDGDVIRAGTKLKIIANYGAGYDKVDVAAAAACGVPVTNIPAAVAETTAELAIALMMAVSRRIGEMNLRMRSEAPENLFGMGREMGGNLFGKTLGIVGMGRIGGCVARIARALGMTVLGMNRHGIDTSLAEQVSMDELLRRSDVVSLHCPLTAETRGLIDEAAIAQMKPGAILINTARGPVVDEEALARAVAEGRLAGAGIDVYPDEPHVPACLLEQPRIVLTPHVGSNTADARRLMAQMCSAQILDALAGKRPENIVNGL